MRLRLFTAALVLLAAAGCSSESTTAPENQLTTNNFDSLAGWGADSPSLTREKAHSGKYAIKIDPNIEYSMAYKNLLGVISPTKLAKLRMTAYAYVTKPNSGAVLTLQVNQSAQDGTNVFNQGIDLGTEVKKAGEWTKVSKVFTLPATIAASNELRMYLWRANASAPVYVDDIELSIEP